MNRSLLISLIAPGILSGTLACKTPRSHDRADLKHAFGKTFVARDTPPEPCTNMNETSPEGRYVAAIMNYITSKNPDTFQGYLDPKKFCIKVVRINTINAAMDSQSGTMLIYPKILKVKGLETDAGLASVVAHELAHFSMAHHLTRKQRPLPAGYSQAKEDALQANFEKLKLDYEQQAARLMESFVAYGDQELDQVIELITTNQRLQKRFGNRMKDNFRKSYDNFLAKPNNDNAQGLLGEIDTWVTQAQEDRQRDSSLYPDASVIAIDSVLKRRENIFAPIEPQKAKINDAYNDLETYRLPIIQYNEQEADEVGFEFYIRAGFAPDLYPQTFVSLAKSQNPKLNCQQITPTSSEPPRFRKGISFNKVHPDFCWRYFDLKFIERKKHASDYAPFISKTPIINLPELDKLRAALPATL